MTTTGCCDLIRHNMTDGRHPTPDDKEGAIVTANLLPNSPSTEYPRSMTLALGSGGPSNLSHRTRGHKRTKSAGNNSFRESSLYTATGLYAHHYRNKTDFRLYNSTHIPVKTYSELNIYDLIASNRLRNGIEVNSESFTNELQNGLLESEEQTINCGFMSFRPKCLQRLATIQAFVFFCCVLVTLQQALSSGYFNSVITTIEKRFDFPSAVTGAIVSTFELGNLLTIIFVSYFGTYRHIPQWIGKGIVITGIGSIVFAIPHFMDIHNPLDNVNVSGPVSDNTCRIPTPAISSPVLEKASHFINPVTAGDPTCVEGGTYNAPHILIFMLAMVLIGCGGTPIFTLGTTYIDDHVKKEDSSMYIGCMYSMVAFGLVCGFLLGGYFIQVHENSFGSGNVPLDISPGHPKWIGAWWAGFILLGILLILISIPFFLFPKNLKPKNRRERRLQSTETDEQIQKSKHISSELANNTMSLVQNRSRSPYQKPEYGRNIKEIPACMWRLLTNPVYLCTCLGSCMELAIVSGFLVFLPKYLETQFSLGKSEANLFAGGIAVPGACVGIFLGGYVLKRFQMKPKGAIQFVLFFNLVCMGLYTALYFLGCDNVRMAGTTLPYSNKFNISRFDAFQVNLTADCNMGCRCSPNELEPVCDTQNKISYYSPCFAGCRTGEGPRNTQNYSNCACISMNMTSYANNQEVTAIPLATAGPCPQLCQAMIPFMILLFVITLVVSITQMPLLMITLRSVEEEERSLALGMQFVIFRLFGYIPSPIIFGNVIDSTCIVWKAHCGQQGGFCLLYNIEQFRLRYVGVCSGLKVAAGLLFFLDWLLICWRHKKDKTKPPTLGEIVSSIISLDRLSVFGWNTLEIREDDEEQPLGPDSDYNSANDMDDQEMIEREQEFTLVVPENESTYGLSKV